MIKYLFVQLLHQRVRNDVLVKMLVHDERVSPNFEKELKILTHSAKANYEHIIREELRLINPDVLDFLRSELEGL